MAKRLARSSFLARKQSNGYISTAGGKTHKSSENSKLIFSPKYVGFGLMGARRPPSPREKEQASDLKYMVKLTHAALH